MAWRDLPAMVTVSSGQLVDMAKLKQQGVIGVIAEYGAGLGEADRSWIGKICGDAAAVGLPVILAYRIYCAITNVSQSSVAGVQWQYAYTPIKGLTFNGFAIMPIFTDDEGKPATSPNISEALRGFAKLVSDNLKVQVFIRSSNELAEKSPDTANSWLSIYPFYLSDRRYRLKDPGGDRSKDTYVSYVYNTPPILTTLAEMRKECFAPDINHFPPDNASSPLVPGNAQRVLWEFTWVRFHLDGIHNAYGKDDSCGIVIVNTTKENFYTMIKFVEQPGDPNPPDDDPNPPEPGTQPYALMIKGPDYFAQGKLTFNGVEMPVRGVSVIINEGNPVMLVQVPLDKVKIVTE